jgi:hypothetical protein
MHLHLLLLTLIHIEVIEECRSSLVGQASFCTSGCRQMAVRSAAGLCIRTDMAYDEGHVVHRAESFGASYSIMVKVSAPRATTSPLNLGVSPIRVPPNPKSSKSVRLKRKTLQILRFGEGVRLGFKV